MSFYRISQHRFATVLGDYAFAPAFSNGSDVFIADLFFSQNTKSLQQLQLTHELVHSADMGCRLSYSREWVVFAEPRIAKIREEIARTNSRDFFNLQQRLYINDEWPSLYTVTSLKEAFADYCSTSLVDPYFKIASSFFSLKQRISKPTWQDQSWRKSLALGVLLFDRQDYEHASRCFETCKSIDAQSPMPYVYLSRCYFHEGNYKQCIQSGGQATNCFIDAGVPPTDENFANLKKLIETARACPSRIDSVQ